MTWGGRGRGAASLRGRRLRLRRLLSAGLVAAALAAALPALAPAAPALVPVVVAARDLPAGLRLGSADLRIAGWSADTVPASAVSGARGSVGEAVGRVTSGALTRGAAVTEAGLLGPGLLSGQPAGLLAVPVRVSGAGLDGLLRRGDRVDVISAAAAQAVVTDVVVLAEPVRGPAADDWGTAQPAGTAGADRPVIVAVRLSQAEQLAQAEASGPLVLAVHQR